MARIDSQRTERPRRSRHERTDSGRRGKRRTAPWVPLLAVAVAVAIFVAGGVALFRAVRPQASLASQPAPEQVSTETSVAPVASEAVAASSAETPEGEAAATQESPGGPGSDQAVTVLMYHHIMPKPNNSIAITPDTFDDQMKYLKENGYHPVSIKQFNAFVERGEQLPDKPVLITFDDNRMNQLEYGVPILKKYGFTATFFVVKKWVDAESDSFMHESELKELIADGFDVESHTANHVQIHPSKLKSTGKVENYKSFKSRYWEPTEGMRTWMDETLGGTVSALAYPGGRYNPEAERLMKDAGYTSAFTTTDGYVTYKGQSSYALPRWNPGARDTSMSRFASIMKGAKDHERDDSSD